MPSTTGRTKRAKMMKKARSLVRMPACIRRICVFLIWSSCSILKLLRMPRTRSAATFLLVIFLRLLVDATMPALSCSRRSLTAMTCPASRSRTEDTSEIATITASVATALRMVSTQMTSTPRRVGPEGAFIVGFPLNLEADHFGHDEHADAHPTQPAEAGDHQPLVAEEAAHVVRVHHVNEREDDERQ